MDIDNLCLANAGGVLGYQVKHRLHVTRRIGDYAENVADRRLLLQRLVPFADDPRELCFVSGIGGRRRTAFGALPPFSVIAFRRRALIGSPPALERRLIASPCAKDKACSGSD